MARPHPQQTSADLADALPDYILSADVEEVARQVIADNVGFRSIEDIRMAYAIRHDAKTDPENDNIDDVVGVAKAGPIWACLGEYDVVVWVKDDYWKAMAEHRSAVITHALSHILVTEEGKIKKVGHDVEAFVRETARFGAWSARLQLFQRSFFEPKRPPVRVTVDEVQPEAEAAADDYPDRPPRRPDPTHIDTLRNRAAEARADKPARKPPTVTM